MSQYRMNVWKFNDREIKHTKIPPNYLRRNLRVTFISYGTKILKSRVNLHRFCILREKVTVMKRVGD